MTTTEAAALITAAVSAAHITSPNEIAKALDALGLLANADPANKGEPMPKPK